MNSIELIDLLSKIQTISTNILALTFTRSFFSKEKNTYVVEYCNLLNNKYNSLILAGFPEYEKEELDFEYFLTSIDSFHELYLYLIFEEELPMKEFYIIKNMKNITWRRKFYGFLPDPADKTTIYYSRL